MGWWAPLPSGTISVLYSRSGFFGIGKLNSQSQKVIEGGLPISAPIFIGDSCIYLVEEMHQLFVKVHHRFWRSRRASPGGAGRRIFRVPRVIITRHASRITNRASQGHASHITHPVSRITHHTSHITHHTSRITHHGTRITGQGSNQDAVTSNRSTVPARSTKPAWGQLCGPP